MTTNDRSIIDKSESVPHMQEELRQAIARLIMEFEAKTGATVEDVALSQDELCLIHGPKIFRRKVRVELVPVPDAQID